LAGTDIFSEVKDIRTARGPVDGKESVVLLATALLLKERDDLLFAGIFVQVGLG